MVERRNYKEELDQMLAEAGGFYTFDDILQFINEGKMQSFSAGNTWVVTQVHEFPRKKVLDIAFVVGDMKDLENLEGQLEVFRNKVGADMIMATGRLGWLKAHKVFPGWKATSVNFVRV